MEPTFRAWYQRKMLATPELVAETKLAERLLGEIKTIAIVGISKDEHRDSHYVGRYLKYAGYTIVQVNPRSKTILGETCYPNLKTIPFHVDAVDVFRKPTEILAGRRSDRDRGETRLAAAWHRDSSRGDSKSAECQANSDSKSLHESGSSVSHKNFTISNNYQLITQGAIP